MHFRRIRLALRAQKALAVPLLQLARDVDHVLAGVTALRDLHLPPEELLVAGV